MIAELDSVQMHEFARLCDELEPLSPNERQQRLAKLRSDQPEIASLLHAFYLAPPPQPEPRLPFNFDDWEVIERLGEGGCGIVYRAKHFVSCSGQPGNGHPRPVALKIIRPERFNLEFLARFEEEVGHLVSLSGAPGVVQIIKAGHFQISGGPDVRYFLMQFVDGTCLDKFCRGLEPRKIVELFCKVCDAVQIVHKHGIMHLDLKPSNVLVTHAGQPVVLDFGLAGQFNPYARLCAAGGTLAYMAPEQMDSTVGSVDFRTDVYALGVMLFELLTSRPPYRTLDASRSEYLRCIANGELFRLREVNSRLDATLGEILNEALATNPCDRPQSPADLARKLRAWIKTRNRVIWAKTIVALIGLLAVLSLLGVTIRHNQNEKDRAKLAFAVGSALAMNGQSTNEVGRPILEVALKRAGFPDTSANKIVEEFSQLENNAGVPGHFPADAKNQRVQLEAKLKGQWNVLFGSHHVAYIDFGFDLSRLLLMLRSWDALETNANLISATQDTLASLQLRIVELGLRDDFAYQIRSLHSSDFGNLTTRTNAIRVFERALRAFDEEPF